MAARLTMLDIAKSKNNDAAVGIVEEAVAFVPEIAAFDSRTVGTTNYKTLHRTGLPTAGFRALNAGITASKSTLINRLHECFPFGARVEADKQAADAWDGGAAAYFAIEEVGVGKAAMIKLGNQLFYGTGIPESDKGFQGLKNFVPKGTTITLATGETRNVTVDATGSASNAVTSVYGVKFGLQGVQLIFGQGDVFRLPPPRIESVRNTTDNTTAFDAYVSQMDGWVGLQIASPFAVYRLLNVDPSVGTTHGVTDKLLEQLRSQAPVGWEPDVWFMSKSARYSLQAARTVTLQANSGARPTGRDTNFAPVPTTDSAGIPIIATDSILNTDAVES